MSEQAPERRSGGNVFTRRIGPLPMWQWLLIALAILGVYVVMQYRKKNASAANTAAGTPAGGTTGAGQVPQFVDQTYTTVMPPAAAQPPPGAAAMPPHAADSGFRPPSRQPAAPNPNIGETIYNAAGRNLGQYQVGQAQVQYVKSSIGSYGITAAEAADVAKAYQNAVARYGQAQADTFHYSYNSPGNVTAQIGSTLTRVL